MTIVYITVTGLGALRLGLWIIAAIHHLLAPREVVPASVQQASLPRALAVADQRLRSRKNPWGGKVVGWRDFQTSCPGPLPRGAHRSCRVPEIRRAEKIRRAGTGPRVGSAELAEKGGGWLTVNQREAL